MAKLIPCPSCGHDISSSVRTCPQCKASIGATKYLTRRCKLCRAANQIDARQVVPGLHYHFTCASCGEDNTILVMPLLAKLILFAVGGFFAFALIWGFVAGFLNVVLPPSMQFR